MTQISSRDNPQYKRVGKAASGRDPDHIVLEGIHLCQAWLAQGRFPEIALFDPQQLQQNRELSALAGVLDPMRRVICDSRLMRSLSHVESAQGIYFLVKRPRPPIPDRIEHGCLWLDRVQDPGNLGTLLRTAAAAGITQAYLSVGTASAWSQKVLRSAQGAHFVMSIYEHVDLHAVHDKLAIALVATTLEQGVSLYSADLPERCAWLMGNEGRGIGAELLQLADVRVFVPQAQGVESLNVAVAGAVCLFEHRRQQLVRRPEAQSVCAPVKTNLFNDFGGDFFD